MEDERQAGDGEENPTSPKPTKWTPNQHHLKVLLGMGINRNAAIKALYYTGNQGPDFAAAWLFENNDEDIDAPLDLDPLDESDTEDDDAPETYKMVFAVNCELDMGTGKIAAQVAHAVLGLYRLLLQDERKYGNMLLLWEEYGETKIALRALSTQHLLSLEKKASELGLPTYLVQDAGRTQPRPREGSAYIARVDPASPVLRRSRRLAGLSPQPADMDDTGKGDNNLANGEQQSHPARQADHGILEHQQRNISTKPDEDFQHFVEYYVRVPEGSTTVLGIMGRMDLVDQVTGGLRLL